jgi:hypothetical protein
MISNNYLILCETSPLHVLVAEGVLYFFDSATAMAGNGLEYTYSQIITRLHQPMVKAYANEI